MQPDRRHQLGLRGEELAAQQAVARGWTPWRRRWRVAQTEVDLCLRRDTPAGLALLLLEVKTATYDHPDLARRWTPRQQARLWHAAAHVAEIEGAVHVEVALAMVVLRPGSEKLHWLTAEPF